MPIIEPGRPLAHQHGGHVPHLPITDHGKDAPVPVPPARLQGDPRGDQLRQALLRRAGIPDLACAAAMHLWRVQAHDANSLPAAAQGIAVHHPTTFLRRGGAGGGEF